jgi:hypothetical protein
MEITMCFLLDEDQKVEEMVSEEQHVQVGLKKVLVAMETKRTDFDNIRQDVNKVKKYATDLQTFIEVNKITSVVDGTVYTDMSVKLRLKVDIRLSCWFWCNTQFYFLWNLRL